MIFSHGADPNAECVVDTTPLSVAMSQAPFNVIELLFDLGGSIDHGQLLHHAVWREADDHLQVLAYLFDKGAPIDNVMNQDREDSYALQITSALGTPLHSVAAPGKLDVVQWLLDRGAHPLIKNSIGRTPLETAEARGHQAIAEYLRPITAAAIEPAEQFTE